MQLNIYFTPTDLTAVEARPEDIYIVIDVIRATTTLTVMFEQGAKRVLIANTLEQAREAANVVPGRLLCGERHALPPADFDYGNSPAQFAQLDLHGRELILTTTNGTRAFFACPEQSIRLAGCFYNAQAVTAFALQQARIRDSNIAIVCSAEASYFALDDAVCAGYLALEIQKQDSSVQFNESVHAASALYRTYAPPVLLDFCSSAQTVARAGLQDDLDICMKINGSTYVPGVVDREIETGLWGLERIGTDD